MIMTLNPNVAPGGNFNLSKRKILLPIDSSGKGSSTAVEVSDLRRDESEYFYTGSDDVMVFHAPVHGAATSGPSYALSELRKMNGTARAAWHLKTGGFMSAALEVGPAPMRDGQGERVVIGPIRGRDDELVRLYGRLN